MKYCDFYNEILEEGLKDYLLSLGVASSILMSPNVDAQIKKNLSDPQDNTNTHLNGDFIKQYIIKHEGIRSKAYLDSKNNLTIGIGHFIQGNEKELFNRLYKGSVDYDRVTDRSTVIDTSTDRCII